MDTKNPPKDKSIAKKLITPYISGPFPAERLDW